MRKTLFAAAALSVLLACMPAAQAGALYSYSFQMTAGPVGGTVSGQLQFDFIGVGGTGTGAASLVTIDSLPAGLEPLPQPSPATSWGTQVANNFSIINGIITDYQFMALTGAGGVAAYELCMNDKASVGIANRSCPTNLNFLGEGASTLFGYNFDGARGISFTEIGATAGQVPEPASLGLVALALLGLATSRRRG